VVRVEPITTGTNNWACGAADEEGELGVAVAPELVEDVVDVEDDKPEDGTVQVLRYWRRLSAIRLPKPVAGS
jgi:hypothetical protein